ncbi:MAG: hypothetical protein EON52_24220 [Actinomycetales bacterium]|nr:MAG: hypothetical protein EON52_24220 [Actinomycetales bacterium]
MNQSVEHRPRPVDRTVSWSLYVVQLLASVLLGLLAVTSIFMTDSCGSVDDEPAVCNIGYFGSTLFGYWFVLVVLAVVVPLAVVRTTHSGRASWPWALLGLAATAAATVLFVVLMTR